jgi:acetoin utilization deacetylase AcuC-like enzyme
VGARSLWVVDDAIFDEHRARGHHPERPERLLAARAAVEQLAQDGVRLERLAARDATREDLRRVHGDAYLDELDSRRGSFSSLDADTFLGPRSVEAAHRAAGGALALTDALLGGHGPRHGVALLRPPGHHARPQGGMGFCLVNNVAVAAARARTRGLERIAIVDWDVHHGNGTEEAFYDDPGVLVVSLHQDAFYPGTGQREHRGVGAGEGYNVNVPLSAGAGDEAYRAAFARVVLPVLERYAPQLVLVSAGFDAHARDPLAGMTLSDQGFGWMARELSRIASKHAEGRIGLLLEGGYDLEGVERSLLASLRGLYDEGGEAARQASEVSAARAVAFEAVSTAHRLEIEAAREIASTTFHL